MQLEARNAQISGTLPQIEVDGSASLLEPEALEKIKQLEAVKVNLSDLPQIDIDGSASLNPAALEKIKQLEADKVNSSDIAKPEDIDGSASLNPAALEKIKQLEADKANSSDVVKPEDVDGSASLNPAALEKIKHLEAVKVNDPQAEEHKFGLPTFIQHINDIICNEEGTARFECSLEPINDPNMKVDWQLNGKPISCGSRILANADFGLVSLDIQGVQKGDEGVFTCIAQNQAGNASTSGTLKVNMSNDGIVQDTLHPKGESGLENIIKFEEPKMSIQVNLNSPTEPVQEASLKPIFTSLLPDKVSVTPGDGAMLHLQCNVEPKNDPNLAINWYHNGLPLPSATRIMAKNDFGFVTLDISDMSIRDQGVYTCKAITSAGEAVTFTTVDCADSASLDFDTKHPKGKEGLQAISNFENKLQLPDDEEDSDTIGQAPEFVQQFKDVTVTEGDRAYFEAKLKHDKTADSDLILNWVFNGKPLQESSRYKKVYSFGMVILEIGNVSSTDSGTYTCTAENKFGSATSDPVKLQFVEEKSSHCPKFTGGLLDQLDLKDGQSVHLQCALSPVNDPDLKVEWFFNQNQLPNSSRLKTVADFGFVMLDIAGIDSRDSGEYTCRAWNKYGEDTISCQLQCEGKSGVQLQSLHPDALAKIKNIELTGTRWPMLLLP